MAKSPEIFDPYLGKMWGNILDQYDNPTYSLKLYLKPEEASAATSTSPATTAGQTSSTSSGDAARSDTASGSSTTTKVTDKKIVVLAQTGVTASQIDDLELECYADASRSTGGVKTLTATFTVIQPGAANFIDQIQWGRKYLGASNDKLSSTDFYLYLDINFYGYASDPEDNEARGEPIQIVDTATYKLKVLNIGVKIDNTGSRYTFETAHVPGTGFADSIFKIPQTIELRGRTISECIKDFERQYNDILKNTSTEYIPDEVSFNLNALLKGTGGPTSSLGNSGTGFIKDESLPAPASDEKVETRAEPSFDKPPETAKEQRQDADGSATAGKSKEQRINERKIPIKEGKTIVEVIGEILLSNKEFQTYVTRKQELDNPGSTKVDIDKTFIYWYDLHCEIQNLKWDKRRNVYAKKYIYTPYLVADARSDISLTTSELEHLTDTETVVGGSGKKPIAGIATKRLQEIYNAGVLSKSYFYIFTGLNDQIINLDINLDNALTILMPPKGGMIGEFSVTNSTALTNSEPRTKDMTLGDKLEAAKKAQNAKSLVDIFKQIKGLASDMNGLAQSLGRSVEQIKAAVDDVQGKTALALAQSIDGATLDRTLKKIGVSESSDPAAVPGTITEISRTNLSGAYSPEVSGFLYSDDFVQPGGNITKEEFEAAGLIELDSKVPTGVSYAQPLTKSLPSPLSGMAVDGPSSMLMGYVYRARKSTHFLLDINLTLRGDPYWLTSINSGPFDEKTKPSREKTQNPPPGKKYYFLLTIGTPSRFDYNVNDEDANTGYWSDGRTSGVFSGLYYPIEWKNRFSNGIFTTEMVAVKEISVPLQWIKRVPLGEKPTDWDAKGITNDVVDDLLAASKRTTLKPDTNPNITSNPSAPNPTGFANPLGDARYRVGDGLGAGRNHGGVDMAADAGTPVYAAKGGTIVLSGEVSGYGQVVYIDHGDGTQTRYGHLQDGSRTFSSGQTVQAGQVIGKVGSTGRSTGPHLHYEVRTGTSSSTSNDATRPVDASRYIGRGG